MKKAVKKPPVVPPVEITLKIPANKVKLIVKDKNGHYIGTFIMGQTDFEFHLPKSKLAIKRGIKYRFLSLIHKTGLIHQ